MRHRWVGRRLGFVFFALLSVAVVGGCGSSGSGGSDEDGGSTLRIADAALDEGDVGTTNLTFVVTLSAAESADVTVDFATSSGSASAGADCNTTSGTVIFPARVVSRGIEIPVRGDLLEEADESFIVGLSQLGGNATLGDANASGTIRDNDPLPSVSIGDAQVDEGNSGTTSLTFSVTLTPASGRAVSVNYATSNGTAASGSDYNATSGTLSFSAGQTSRPLAVTIRGDGLLEADETFTLTLSAPSNATLADATATGTILNDDVSGGGLGLDARPSNATCVAPARPSGNASVAVVDAFNPSPGFGAITKLLQAPGDASRWFVLEKGGRVQVFSTSNPGSVSTWIDLSASVNDAGEGGLLGLAFHPSWPATRHVFVSYTANGSPLTSRLSRLILDNVTTPSPPTEQILLTVDQPFDSHNGGDIAFGNDGYLYFGLGDGGGGNPGNRPQDPTLLLGKMLRIGVVGVAFPSPGYTIPADNPYATNPRCGPGANAQACPEIFASGFRNPWRWSIDAPTGAIWVGDVGEASREEVDLVTLGGNYGWNCREGFSSYPGTGPCVEPFIDPVVDYSHSNGDRSIIGGFVYRGSAIPSLQGRYVFGDFISGRIWALQPNGTGGYVRDELIDSIDAITSFGLGADGELYYASNFATGIIRKIVPPSGGGPVDTIPTNLVDTGCVDASNPQQPASGLVQYGVQAPFWSDSAVKERHLAIPDGTAISVGTLSGNAGGDFTFPSGSVILKNFRLNDQLIETRLFMRHPDGIWGGYTYEWNDAQTAATRVIGGKTRSVQGQTWIYPSEGACLECHTAAAGFALGPEVAQLNGLLTYEATGRTANQLDTLDGIGMFSGPLPGPSGSLPALVDPADSGAPLTDRARAWLHTNCAQCHRPGGPTPSSMDLRFSTALNATNACDTTPQSGSFGIAGARLIAPGDAARSIVIYRANRRDASGMPPIGSGVVDAAGVALLSDWVESISGCN